ncbi:MAG: hypothetical protein KHX40_06900 [Oscillospiraceae bacterium]|nr:hypothetical protein [Oscillospiraceae bacterium]
MKEKQAKELYAKLHFASWKIVDFLSLSYLVLCGSRLILKAGPVYFSAVQAAGMKMA